MAGSIQSDDGDLGFQIAPMVDVVFVLLLFFMASAGSQIVEKELAVDLPKKGITLPGTARAWLVIDISSDGQVSLNDEAFGTPNDRNLARLRSKLNGLIDDFGDADPVLIRPSGDTRHERIIEVLNACTAAKVKNLTFS
jgi:biopolymer transport protein ExbD